MWLWGVLRLLQTGVELPQVNRKSDQTWDRIVKKVGKAIAEKGVFWWFDDLCFGSGSVQNSALQYSTVAGKDPLKLHHQSGSAKIEHP